MNRFLFLFCLLIASKSFATGPDSTVSDLLGSNERTQSIDTNQLACSSGSSVLNLTNLGLLREEVALFSGPSNNCKLANEVKAETKAELHLQFMLYRETPIDWMTGEPTGAPSYYSCVTIAKFQNGLVVSAWYWNPKDPGSCN